MESTETASTESNASQPTSHYGTVLHALGVLLSLAALAMHGVTSPNVGLPLAVGALAGFGLVSSPPTSAPPAVVHTVRGGVLKGGMKQGAAIKSMFAVALLYAGSYPVLFGDDSVVVPSLLLGSALGVSAVGTALEARWLGRLAETKWNGQS